MTIQHNDTYQFNMIVPDEGMILTTWNKEDIMEYGASEIMYTPKSHDNSDVYEITMEEHLALLKEQENKMMMEMKKDGH